MGQIHGGGEAGGEARLRALLAAGEGALAGFAVGGVFGAWELFVSQNLSHGLVRLAVHRMAVRVSAGALFGVLASLLLYVLLHGLRRLLAGRLGIPLLAAAFLAGTFLVAVPLREVFFHLRVFSSRSLFASVLLAQTAVAALLLVRRAREALCADSPGGRRTSGSGLACAGAGLLLASGLTWCATPRLPLAPGVTGRPVILVSLDTLRADRVGFLGGARRLTPRLDELALEGAVFEQAQSPAPWTLPSHASVFTSLLPYDHGCRWDHDMMRPRHVTLAERFWNAGYRTAAFTGGGFVSASFGFDHGFEVYEDHDEIREGGPEAILAAALRWVRERRNEPYFLFLHTYEIHSPLRRGDLADPRDAGRLPGIIDNPSFDAMHAGQLVLTPQERRYVTDYYDGGVAHADMMVGGFLEALRREGVLDRAILMVISDHGEELWERYPTRGPGHGHSLYQELQHVPWLVRAPGLVPAGRRVREPVTLLDLSPTIQEMTGLPADPSQAGSSLAGALLHGVEPSRREIVMESVEYGPERFAMREGNYKVILTPAPDRFDKRLPLEVPPLQVFDLAADPGERVDLAGRMEDSPRRMTRALFDRFRQVPRAHEGDRREADLPADLRRQLESLGYVH